MRLFFLSLFSLFLGGVYSYGTSPPPPPPCNTPQCPSGQFCYSNTNLCTTCPSGYKYNNNPNQGVSSTNLWGCTICPIGTFSANEGSSICTLCSPGFFQNSAGQTSCITCPSNTFTNIYGASYCTSCSSCNSNSYVTNTCTLTSDTICHICNGISHCTSPITCSTSSDSICVQCGSGFFLQSNKCNTCATCASGYYETTACTSSNRICSPCTNTCIMGQMLTGICSPTSNMVCVVCPSDYYKTTNDMSSCLPCLANCNIGFELNQICNSITNNICTPCNSNYYKNIADNSKCLQCTNTCPIGFQLNQVCSSTINPICIPCSNGYYKVIEDNSKCLPCTNVCPIGYQLNQLCGPTINPICIMCPSGYYKSIADGSPCLPCTSICNSGFELNQVCISTVNPICIPCLTGYYSPNGIKCLQCTSDCGAGSYLTNYCNATTNPGCNNCPANTANPNRFSYLLSSCITCPNGAISAIGSATCLQCSLGTATFGNNNCSNCTIGTYADTLGSITCKLCPAFTANNNTMSTGINSCISCNVGYYSKIGSSSCNMCPNGTYGIFDASSINDCLMCPMGYYNNKMGQSICTMCPAGTSNYYTNSTSINNCTQCPPGSYSNAGSPVCILCPVGTSSYLIGATSCIYNLPGTFTNTNGSTSATNCYPGYFTDLIGSITCRGCPRGTFNNNTGSTNFSNCIQCPIGYFSQFDASTYCIQCPRGAYQDKPGQHTYSMCPIGFFNNYIGSTSSTACSVCPSGKYNSIVGQSNCTICPSGFYQYADGMASCIACPPGTFNINNGSITSYDCILCPPGTFSNVTAANSINTCNVTPPGTFTNSSGSSNYTLCNMGTYQNNTNQTSCTECMSGTYNTYYGSTNITCIPSPIGYYIPYNGSHIYLPCNMGFYTDTVGNSECKPCVPGTFNNITGSNNCTTCMYGTFALGYGFTVCDIIGDVKINYNNITNNSASIVVNTNFTALLPFNYTCNNICYIYINNNVMQSGVTQSGVTNNLILLPLILGVDTITVVFNGTFESTLNMNWDCKNNNFSMMECSCIPPNNIILSALLSITKDNNNIYGDPIIILSSDIVTTSLSQTYTFNVKNLEAYVNYSINIMFQIINTTEPFTPLILNSVVFRTLPSIPTGTVQNLVKYFIGIDVVAQANNEQSNLQIHWDIPLILFQHGPIIGYNVSYIQEERTYITYGNNLFFITIPQKEQSIFTNDTTLIISNLVPDTNYSITVHPMTTISEQGPGSNIILTTQVSAPPKPPVLTLLDQEFNNITVSWTSLTNETGIITKAWIIAEPYEVDQLSSQVVIIPVNNSDLPPLPFPNTGIQGVFTSYNASNQCEEHILGLTFRSLFSDNICGGICDNRCEHGTPMLDPTTILPTNDQTLFNDNYIMNFNITNITNITNATRLVPYLTMKKRFVLNTSDGGLNLGGKVVIGDGKINPNSNLNNTLLNSSLVYRIRLIVFTSEVLYAVSDSLEIKPIPQPAAANFVQSVYFAVGITISIIIIFLIVFTLVKRHLYRINSKIIEESNNPIIVNKINTVSNPMYNEINNNKIPMYDIIDSDNNVVHNEPPYNEPQHNEPQHNEPPYTKLLHQFITDGPMLPPKKSSILFDEQKYLDVNNLDVNNNELDYNKIIHQFINEPNINNENTYLDVNNPPTLPLPPKKFISDIYDSSQHDL